MDQKQQQIDAFKPKDKRRYLDFYLNTDKFWVTALLRFVKCNIASIYNYIELALSFFFKKKIYQCRYLLIDLSLHLRSYKSLIVGINAQKADLQQRGCQIMFANSYITFFFFSLLENRGWMSGKLENWF